MDNRLKKIALGTVQFGLDYGICNQFGKTDKKEVSKILEVCKLNGINTLDTASAYGNSEQVLGHFIKDDFNLISKFSLTDMSVEESFNLTTKNLRQKNIYGYLFHHLNDFKNRNVRKHFTKLKEDGRIQKIGFSIYDTSDLDLILSTNFNFDLIQIPFNLFNQEFSTRLKELKDKNIEIHIRSVFQQGLVFMDSKKMNSFFKPIERIFNKLDDVAKQKNVSKASIALQFVLEHNEIDKVIIGVENVEQLRHNINTIKSINFEEKINFKQFEIENKLFTNPSNWKLQ